MRIPKKCELCSKIYQCRKDKIKSARFCSRHCKSVNAGRVSFVKCKQRWDLDSQEQFIEKMRIHFETFFEKAEGCWLWVPRSGKELTEYGSFTFRGKHYKSNRAAWLIYHGDIPKDRYVLHKCDVRNCVNPDHLFLGTHDDNMKDMAAKRRYVLPNVKLTEQQVNEIRQKLAMGVTTTRLAKDFGVSATCIWYIRHGKSWKGLN
jgi:hypothetical protein